ncbi:MAG: DUF1543 domain-containing protein [Tatlockia sp.]|nr:DUF1543 domain-containing protein [Tatlockia sp.]
MKLFVIYIGGSHIKSLIELHDIRFVLADKIEDTYDTLRESWWGISKSLHIDAWGNLGYADGYKIEISKRDKKKNIKKLYFVNLGGYDPKQFTELHKNIFVVASSESEARHKAIQHIREWQVPHLDFLYQIDNLLNINLLIEEEGYHLHLIEQRDPEPFSFICQYNPIGKKTLEE